ncbi:sulfatase [Halopenitus persicus]|uniref:Arylsulfatase A n=1 Tax=Halopenitus persicus TaxID=1048396 RepID=A0A1H3P6D7_9EURY|nr:sulfatase [Halopenitus persicus]SDY96533.1 Arylsulfatase A [Halopenitus persicus]
MKYEPHIIWISVESLRADHTTMGGYERNTTPNLNEISNKKKGNYFDNCFCQSMWTPAVTASILTGTYLSRHRLGIDGTADDIIPSDLDTLPEIFEAEGYETGCFSPNPYLSPATDLDRGFEDFHWLTLDRPQDFGLISTLKYLSRVNSYGPGITIDRQRHNLSYILTEGAKQWLRRSSDQVFLYLHIGNPHHPYLPPKAWRDAFTDEIELTTEKAMEISADIFEDNNSIKKTIANGCNLSASEWEAIKAMYDAEILFADHQIGELFDYAKSVLDDEVIFIITGDHGELFGEGGVIGHNLILHDAVTNVPLVIYGFPDLDTTQSDFIQHIDITRTVASLIDADREQFQGTDLHSRSPKFTISQRGIAHLDAYINHNPDFNIDRYHSNPITAIRSTSFKYQATRDQRELFVLPDESRDVINEYDEVTEQFEEHLQKISNWKMTDTDKESNGEFTEAMEDQLKDLGYL